MYFGIKKSTIVWFLILAGGVSIGLGVTLFYSKELNIYGILTSTITRVRGAPPPARIAGSLQYFGIEPIIVGGFLVVLALYLRFSEKLTLRFRSTQLMVGSTAVIILVLWLPTILVGNSTVVNGTRYWFLFDDEMISMTYARNLANGFGLVWNQEERVEGYSNFLWTIIMAAVHYLPMHASNLPLVVLFINLALSLATIPFILQVARALCGDQWVITFSLIGFVLSKNMFFWATAGAETALLTLLFVFALARILEESVSHKPTIVTFLLVGLVSLVRADAIVLAGILYALALTINPLKRREVLLYSIVSLALPFAHLLFRIGYYGDVLPNTAYLKTTNWDGRLDAGIAYTFDFLRRYLPMLLFILLGFVLRFKTTERLLAGGVFVYILFVTYAGGDVFQDFRFFVPVLPLLFILCFSAIREIFQNSTIQIATAVICLIWMPLTIPGYTPTLFPTGSDTSNVHIGLVIKKNSLPESTVADFWAGSVIYWSERRGIDLLGKSDRYIARLQAKPGGTKPGHNKYDFEYSLGRLHPDIVVAMFQLPVDEKAVKGQSVGDFSFTGQLYFDNTFRKHCLNNPVNLSLGRTIFICDWSTELANRSNWLDY